MTRTEWITTLLNVASDLEAIAEHIDAPDTGQIELDEAIATAKLACEYITHEQPHL